MQPTNSPCFRNACGHLRAASPGCLDEGACSVAQRPLPHARLVAASETESRRVVVGPASAEGKDARGQHVRAKPTKHTDITSGRDKRRENLLPCVRVHQHSDSL